MVGLTTVDLRFGLFSQRSQRLTVPVIFRGRVVRRFLSIRCSYRAIASRLSMRAIPFARLVVNRFHQLTLIRLIIMWSAKASLHSCICAQDVPCLRLEHAARMGANVHFEANQVGRPIRVRFGVAMLFFHTRVIALTVRCRRAIFRTPTFARSLVNFHLLFNRLSQFRLHANGQVLCRAFPTNRVLTVRREGRSFALQRLYRVFLSYFPLVTNVQVIRRLRRLVRRNASVHPRVLLVARDGVRSYVNNHLLCEFLVRGFTNVRRARRYSNFFGLLWGHSLLYVHFNGFRYLARTWRAIFAYGYQVKGRFRVDDRDQVGVIKQQTFLASHVWFIHRFGALPIRRNFRNYVPFSAHVEARAFRSYHRHVQLSNEDRRRVVRVVFVTNLRRAAYRHFSPINGQGEKRY